MCGHPLGICIEEAIDQKGFGMELLKLPQYARDIALFEPFVPLAGRLSAGEKHEVVTLLLDSLAHVTKQFGAIQAEASEDKRRLLHAALNVLEPGFLQDENIASLNALLQTELSERATVNANVLAHATDLKIQGTAVTLWQGDITTLKIDAIVNAANDRLLGCFQPLHSCIDNAIHSRAGVQLRDDCQRIMQKQAMPEPTGAAKVTRAYNLPSRFVVHTVGPIVQGQLTERHVEELRHSYLSSLNLCAELEDIRSIAFCCISTGVFGYPYEAAAETAFNTVSSWLNQNPGHLDLVVFNVFTDRDRIKYESTMG